MNISSATDQPFLVTNQEISDKTPAQETGDDLAMISLEAAAEPHYVGESSGSLWTTVLTEGLHVAPSFYSDGKPVGGFATMKKSASPTADSILRANLQRPISDEVADRLLDTVYKHVQARVG